MSDAWNEFVRYAVNDYLEDGPEYIDVVELAEENYDGELTQDVLDDLFRDIHTRLSFLASQNLDN